ncbi:YdeI/OmpD-associated family protein [Devosia sp. MC521]|uniref:YdeI/OmpD-associated family protein n=1 Tax=Devosia sp. MC521 TaxID=2759954 RepID=UPI0015F98412|nr:YdeI/OmpD-associated family protein [Devosia sp. MC521]MBJ6987171.1 YdeI/OmpD-associated family protein [Devosia sp. MC521]QMW62786.1 YdeI/OmpD-associated family protein [Devosia sp. MC521]
MAPVVVAQEALREFVSFQEFYDWLANHHDHDAEIWIRIFKKSSGRATISPVEAIDAVLCWGWIDAIKKSWDDVSFAQRYCPRRKKSVWSQVNRDNVARLSAAGLMTPYGLAHVETAKADGRWDAAYATTQEAPDDLLAAIAANPSSQRQYDILTAQNRFALIYRTNGAKTAATRQKRIAQFVEMLARGETIYPQKARWAET